MKIIWFGAAALAFTAEGGSILCDPFFPLNPELPSPAVEELASLGDIFITHGHFDHLIDVPAVAAAGDARVHCCAVAAETLVRDGLERDRITVVKPGDRLQNGPFSVTVYRGKHIRFNGRLIARTLFNRRIFSHWSNFKTMLGHSKRYPPGQVLVYGLEAEGKSILHLGSLNLDRTEKYPERVDVLTLPFQGRSDLDVYALPIVERFRPRLLFLHHCDDAFPPISSRVATRSFTALVNAKLPGIRVVMPRFGAAVEV